MGREIVRSEVFDSSQYDSVRTPRGRFSYYGTLRIMGVSGAVVIRLVRDGLVNGESIDTRAGLTVGDLYQLHNKIKDLREQGIIRPIR